MIETERLRLRPCRESDKPIFATILNTPAMMAKLGGVRSPAQSDALIDRRIELRETGALIGTCGVRIASNYPGKRVQGWHEAGWRIAEAHWGRGYALEAAQASIAWTWAHTDAPLVAAWTTPDNVASWRLMERLGMTRRADLDFRRGDDAEVLRVYVIERA